MKHLITILITAIITFSTLTLSIYVAGHSAGNSASYLQGRESGLAEREVITEEVSIIKEQKDCEVWGGDFKLYESSLITDSIQYKMYCGKIYTDDNKQIIETLFSYTFNQ